MKDLVIDASGAVLGRLASYAAKQALLGKKVTIVNCEEAIITGNPRTTIEEYQYTRTLGSANLQGPYLHKSPEKILKRTIRGMLSHRQARGLSALKRVRCYNQTPDEFKDVKKILAGKEKKTKTIKLGKLSKEI